MMASRPIKGSFQGLGQGFLNSSKAKRRGLSSKADAANVRGTAASSSSSSSSSNLRTAEAFPDTPSAASNSTQAASASAASAGPPAVHTDSVEKRQLLLGAADVDFKVDSD